MPDETTEAETDIIWSRGMIRRFRFPKRGLGGQCLRAMSSSSWSGPSHTDSRLRNERCWKKQDVGILNAMQHERKILSGSNRPRKSLVHLPRPSREAETAKYKVTLVMRSATRDNQSYRMPFGIFKFTPDCTFWSTSTKMSLNGGEPPSEVAVHAGRLRGRSKRKSLACIRR